MKPAPGRLLGVILAGGRSRRFGGDKATAELGGEPMARRVGRALEPRVERVGLVADEMALAESLGWPVRPDVRPGLGPAGGILTALTWARELGAEGAVVLACDLPLVPGSLLDLLVDRFDGRRPVAPASPGPLGMEPLCAVYPARALEEVSELLERGPLPAHELLAGLSPVILGPAELESVCDPGTAFLNVNSVEDRDRAEALIAGASE